MTSMDDSYKTTKRNKVRQLHDKAKYDRDTVHGILDAALLAHVAFVEQGTPVVVPMLFARDDETLYLHGARKARIIRMLEKTETACVNVTLLDGIVLARSAFNSSMNYRSVTVFGTPKLIEDEAGKLVAMKAISEHVMPGRWGELRASHEREIKMTGVIALSIDAASAKISAGDPDDEDEDYAIPIWAGVVPIATSTGSFESDARNLPGVKPSDIVLALQNKML